MPYGWLRRAAAIALGSGAQRSVCAAVAREWAGNAAEITPKVSSNAGQSLSHGLWPCQLPLHKGALGDGGCGLPRRPVGPPRNDNGFLSFRGQCVHWPWESVLFYDGRGFGPPGRRTLRKARSTTKPAGAQQSVRASGREKWAGIDAGTIKKGQASAIARAALSEAESAERGAGQIRFLPDK